MAPEKATPTAAEDRAHIERTEWSDAFFNWRLESFEDGNIIEAAEMFRKLNPGCPMDEEALCLDYVERI
jgi:hypothetical protein